MEEENSDIKHLFSVEAEAVDKFEENIEVIGIERTILAFLRGMLRDRDATLYYADALVYIGVAYELGALNLIRSPCLRSLCVSCPA